MRLLPRHYVFQLAILVLATFNAVRITRAHHQRTASAPAAAVALPTSAGPQTPAWSAYDAAAALRDAPDAQFHTAVEHVHTAQKSDSSTDLSGCLTWLDFYRQREWRDRARSHVDDCVRFHQDVNR
jgi:hypothetical protein